MYKSACVSKWKQQTRLSWFDLCSDSVLIPVYILLQAKSAFGFKFSRMSVKQSPQQSHNTVRYSALQNPKQCELHSNTQINSRSVNLGMSASKFFIEMFWIVTTLFPCLVISAIILSWSLLLLSQPSPQCVMAVQLSLRWFSFHGLFPVSCSKSPGKRGIQCFCRVSAAQNEPFEVLTVHEMQHMRGLVCSTDDWLYVYILYSSLQMSPA